MCEHVRAALPPLSSAGAASAALRYMRGAGEAADERRVVDLFGLIAAAGL